MWRPGRGTCMAWYPCYCLRAYGSSKITWCVRSANCTSGIAIRETECSGSMPGGRSSQLRVSTSTLKTERISAVKLD
jgi:hypothetical protein